MIPRRWFPVTELAPEITHAVTSVLDALHAPFEWDIQQGGLAGIEAHGDPLPGVLLDSIRRTKLALKGPLTTPVGGGFRSVNVRLREEFQLYANLRPSHTLVPGGRYDDIDLILLAREPRRASTSPSSITSRSATTPHAVAISSGVNTRDGAERIIRFAFEHAIKLGRKKVTIVHKANVLKALTGVFLEVGLKMAKEYEGRIACDERIVDACAMQLVLNPVAIRRDRHHQPVRRHPVRSDRRAGRRPRRGAGRQHRQEGGDLRGGAWLGSGHRRQGSRQPDRAAACGRPDARPRRGARQGGSLAQGDRCNAKSG